MLDPGKAFDRVSYCKLFAVLLKRDISPIVLRLLFFIVYGLIITVSDRLNFLMYADDTTIYFILEDFDNLTRETNINRELEKVNIWLKLNKLSLNTQKTKLMPFHRKQKHLDKINVIINGLEIEYVPSFNFLGSMKTYRGKATAKWLVIKI